MHQEESNNQVWAILGSLRMLLISEGESEMIIITSIGKKNDFAGRAETPHFTIVFFRFDEFLKK